MENLKWKFSHASFGNMAENHVTHLAEITDAIPSVEELKSKLAIDGYVYNPEYKLYVYRTVGSDGGTEYGVNCRIGFDKNDSGRGGWKAKIADRRFSVNELLHPVAKPVVPAIMATGNYYSDWRGMWLPKAEKVKIKLVDGKVKMYYMTLEPCVDGELVTLNAKGGPVFRSPLADWQRLQNKQLAGNK